MGGEELLGYDTKLRCWMSQPSRTRQGVNGCQDIIGLLAVVTTLTARRVLLLTPVIHRHLTHLVSGFSSVSRSMKRSKRALATLQGKTANKLSPSL